MLSNLPSVSASCFDCCALTEASGPISSFVRGVCVYWFGEQCNTTQLLPALHDNSYCLAS